MQKTKKKQKWVRPMLTVLDRGDRHEGVLAMCKSSARNSAVTNKNYDACRNNLCAMCSEVEGS